MKFLKNLLAINLHLFDGEGAGGAAPAGDGSASGETTSTVPGAAGRGKTGETKKMVLYGKQPEGAGEQTAAGSEGKEDGKATSDGTQDKEALRKEFQELTQGKYRDIYTEETQRIINQRFKATKATEAKLAALAPALDTLAQHYGITDDADYGKLVEAITGDDTLVADLAEQRGMDVKTWREVDRIRRENAAMKAAQQNDVRQAQLRRDAQRLKEEGAALKAKYPSFDLSSFMADRDSMAAFLAGQPMENVFWASHHDELLAGEIAKAAAGAEKQVTDSIRAKGRRPAENGTSPQGAGFTIKSDPSKLTLADFEEIAKRARNGEKIVF